jgi:hypothetical protein
MSDLFTHLAERVLGQAHLVKPVIAPVFVAPAEVSRLPAEANDKGSDSRNENPEAERPAILAQTTPARLPDRSGTARGAPPLTATGLSKVAPPAAAQKDRPETRRAQPAPIRIEPGEGKPIEERRRFPSQISGAKSPTADPPVPTPGAPTPITGPNQAIKAVPEPAPDSAIPRRSAQPIGAMLLVGPAPRGSLETSAAPAPFAAGEPRAGEIPRLEARLMASNPPHLESPPPPASPIDHSPPNRPRLVIDPARPSPVGPAHEIAPTQPVIHVTISRIEVRAVPPQPPLARPATPRMAPALTLEEYLKQRSGGRR